MPIPFVNFLQAPQPRNYLAEMLATLPEQIQKYKQMQLANAIAATKAKYAEPIAKQDLAQSLLKNAYQSIVNQNAPKDYETLFNNRVANTDQLIAEKNKINYQLNHPGYMGDETTKEIQALIDMGIINNNQLKPSSPNLSMNNITNSNNASNFDSTPFKTGNPIIDSSLNRKFIQSAYQQQMNQGYRWAHLPAETQNQLISQGYGMGIDPVRMQDYVNKGLSLKKIAEAEGLDPENLPPPIYPPTEATKTRTQQVNQVVHELDYISSATTPIIKQYANTFANYSPERIKDMLSNNVDAQKRFGKYIGALSLQSGLANGRVIAEGGKSGLEVLRMVKDSALQGIDQHTPIRMTKIAYDEAQKTVNEILGKGAKIRITTGMNPFQKISKPNLSESSSNRSISTPDKNVVKIVRVNGKLVAK